MAYDSLRPYLQVLEQNGMMRWVDKEVDKDWEISSVLRMIFRAMPEDKRYEIIDGEMHVVPAPSFRHQDFLLNLAIMLRGM